MDRKDVYTIIRNGKEDNKDYWQRVGSAFVNKDGSLSVKLNANPINGELHIRDPRPNGGAKDSGKPA